MLASVWPLPLPSFFFSLGTQQQHHQLVCGRSLPNNIPKGVDCMASRLGTKHIHTYSSVHIHTYIHMHTENHLFPQRKHPLLVIMRCLTHVIKCKVDISPIFSLHHVLESDQVVMSCKSLQIHYLSECALSIGGVPEGIEALLQGQHLTGSFLNGLPDDAICLRETHQSQIE